MDNEAFTSALGAQLERAAALRSLLATLWPELLQLSVPAKVVLATIALLSLVVVLRVLRTIVGVALAILRAPLLLFRRSSSSSSTSSRQQQQQQQEREREQQQQQQRAATGARAGGRGKGGAARRRGGNATEPEEEQQQPEKPPPAPTQGVSLKSLVNASRAAARSSGGGAPQAPAAAASSPLHLSLLKGHGDGIASVAFSADGAFLLSASRDRGLRQWPMMPSASDPETPLRRGAPPTPAQPRTRNLGVSPLAAGFIGGDSSGGIAVLSRDGLNGPTLTAIPPFGSSGSGGSGSDAPPLWEAKPAPLIGGRRPVALLCSSSSSSSSSSPAPAPAPPLIAVVSERTELETFDASSGQRTAAVDTGGLRTHGACCSADGALFAVATFASDAKVYSFGAAGGTNSNSKASSVQKAGWSLSHAGQVLAVSLSRDGSRAATSSRDGTWASWKTPAAATRSGKGLASGERAEAARLGAWRQDLSLPPGEFYRLLSLSPDGTVLAAAAGGDLHFLSAASGELLGRVSPAHGGEVTALCWAPRRRKVEGGEGAEERWILASGGDDRAVRLWAAPEAAGGGGGGGGSGWQRG